MLKNLESLNVNSRRLQRYVPVLPEEDEEFGRVGLRRVGDELVDLGRVRLQNAGGSARLPAWDADTGEKDPFAACVLSLCQNYGKSSKP